MGVSCAHGEEGDLCLQIGVSSPGPRGRPAWPVGGYFSLGAYESWDRAFSLSSLAAGGGPRPIQETPASSTASNWTPLAFAGCGGASFMTFQATAPERREERRALVSHRGGWNCRRSGVLTVRFREKEEPARALQRGLSGNPKLNPGTKWGN